MSYIKAPGKLEKAFYDGRKLNAFAQNLRWQIAVRLAYKLAVTPTGRWSPTSAGRYTHAINVLTACLKQMEGLEGEQLQKCVDRHGLARNEVRQAIAKLKELRETAVTAFDEVKRTHAECIQAAYRAQCKKDDAKSHRAAQKRILPVLRPATHTEL